ncbi:DUF2283 domain-containing protein [Candidatus Korarchaeum cryptofilum]|uniref:DUF2283 domain-containing protein n=2 Tax=Candidatus Korarchaeum cryptofilum TaxID=498846 RepID=A0A3R9PQL8_9CREN|nr:DUF2283 domain-containing protein [Candidatus Korarchaeum cryptofilum]
MKVRFDPEADILYILIEEGPLKDTVEIAEDLFIEIAEDGSIAGLEVWRARENVLKSLLEHIKVMIQEA